MYGDKDDGAFLILKSVGARKLEPDVFYKTKQRMNMDIKSLMNNPYAWVILSVCTILLFVFGIYTWFAGKRKKEFLGEIKRFYQLIFLLGAIKKKNLEFF